MTKKEKGRQEFWRQVGHIGCEVNWLPPIKKLYTPLTDYIHTSAMSACLIVRVQPISRKKM